MGTLDAKNRHWTYLPYGPFKVLNEAGSIEAGHINYSPLLQRGQQRVSLRELTAPILVRRG